MAATPVGAATIIVLEQFSFKYFRKVVFPVPAFPVRNIFSPVSVTNDKPGQIVRCVRWAA